AGSSTARVLQSGESLGRCYECVSRPRHLPAPLALGIPAQLSPLGADQVQRAGLAHPAKRGQKGRSVDESAPAFHAARASSSEGSIPYFPRPTTARVDAAGGL